MQRENAALWLCTEKDEVHVFEKYFFSVHTIGYYCNSRNKESLVF